MLFLNKRFFFLHWANKTCSFGANGLWVLVLPEKKKDFLELGLFLGTLGQSFSSQ